jgi:hypothetical protein
MAAVFRCPSQTSHYLAIGRSKAIKVDLLLAAGPLVAVDTSVASSALGEDAAGMQRISSPRTASTTLGEGASSPGAASETPWFTADDWSDVLEVLKDFLHEQVRCWLSFTRRAHAHTHTQTHTVARISKRTHSQHTPTHTYTLTHTHTLTHT